MSRIKIKKKTRIVQIGSTIQQNYGEKITKHGYGIYTVSEDKYEFFDLKNEKPFLSFFIDSIDCIENGTEKLVNF